MIAGAKRGAGRCAELRVRLLSLFITFRDVMLSGEYALPLRLHFKRTPQMAWQIGRSFKRHLVESLVPSKFTVRLLSFGNAPGRWWRLCGQS